MSSFVAIESAAGPPRLVNLAKVEEIQQEGADLLLLFKGGDRLKISSKDLQEAAERYSWFKGKVDLGNVPVREKEQQEKKPVDSEFDIKYKAWLETLPEHNRGVHTRPVAGNISDEEAVSTRFMWFLLLTFIIAGMTYMAVTNAPYTSTVMGGMAVLAGICAMRIGD